jgi:hypothetical protein
MRNLKEPHGFLGTAASGLLLFAGAFRVGKAINRRVRAVSLSIAGDSGTITICAAKAEVVAPQRALHGHAFAVVHRAPRRSASSSVPVKEE